MSETAGELAPEVTIWTGGEAAPVIGSLLDVMGAAVRPIGLGGPRPSEIAELRRSLDCPSGDDLRKLLVDRPSAYLLLGTLEAVGSEELFTAAGQGTVILTLEPAASSLQALTTLQTARSVRSTDGGKRIRAIDRIVHLPAFDQSPGFLSAAEPYDALGDQRLARFASAGRAGEGSLFARLFDAWHTALQIVEMPISIDASLVGAGEPPEDLREISGGIAAHARVADGSAAVLEVSDGSGDCGRSLHVLGQAGQLRVTDHGYQLRHRGELVDESDARGPIGFADLLADQWRRLLDRPGVIPRGTLPPYEAQASTLACCMATLLSARTAQPESPRKLRELNR